MGNSHSQFTRNYTKLFEVKRILLISLVVHIRSLKHGLINIFILKSGQLSSIKNEKRTRKESGLENISLNEITAEANQTMTRTSFKVIVSKNTKKKASKLKLTFMLMMFSVSYLITTLPVFVIILMRAFMIYVRQNDEIDFDTEFAIAKTLMFTNNSFNIMFLILFGKTLRRDMLDLLLFVACVFKTKSQRKIQRKHNNDSFNNSTSV